MAFKAAWIRPHYFSDFLLSVHTGRLDVSLAFQKWCHSRIFALAVAFAFNTLQVSVGHLLNSTFSMRLTQTNCSLSFPSLLRPLDPHLPCSTFLFSRVLNYLLIRCIIFIVLYCSILSFTTSCMSGGTLSVLLTIIFQVSRTVSSIQQVLN